MKTNRVDSQMPEFVIGTVASEGRRWTDLRLGRLYDCFDGESAREAALDLLWRPVREECRRLQACLRLQMNFLRITAVMEALVQAIKREFLWQKEAETVEYRGSESPSR